MDEATIAGFRKRSEGSAKYVEEEVDSTNRIEGVLLAIGRSREYDPLLWQGRVDFHQVW